MSRDFRPETGAPSRNADPIKAASGVRGHKIGGVQSGVVEQPVHDYTYGCSKPRFRVLVERALAQSANVA